MAPLGPNKGLPTLVAASSFIHARGICDDLAKRIPHAVSPLPRRMAPPNLQATELLASGCPLRCRNGAPVILGIDEAGRGPVMGPMVYGAAYWPAAEHDAMCALGFDDSKALSAASRAQLFDKMQSTEGLGWIVRLISAAEISDEMLRQSRNLNEMSRDAAIQLIQEVQKKGVVVKQVFVDTVGDPRWYQSFLTKHFGGTIEFRVEKKADSLFKVVSAASIAAKVTRDRVISDWKWESAALDLPTDFGSGYPSDPKTKTWLANHMDDVFMFPNIIRFSWGTVEPFSEKAVKVEWPHEKELDKANAPAGTQSITSFLATTSTQGKPKVAATRAAFFAQRNMHDVNDF